MFETWESNRQTGGGGLDFGGKESEKGGRGREELVLSVRS